MKPLTLGILGLSEGNGHPYSWAAIFNGYNPQEMNECPFPAIPKYFSTRTFPDDAISDAQVAYIWTQNKSLSRHIAKAAKIDCVVDHYKDMIGKVDGILLARDDAETHFEMSAPFIEAGIPIYIDKPIATSIKDAERIYSLQQYNGQIFTCTALSYAKEFNLDEKKRRHLGQIKYIDACVVNSWEKYGIHIIEPVLNLLSPQDQPFHFNVCQSDDKTIVSVEWESGILTTFAALGKTTAPISIRIFGEDAHQELIFQDTYSAFKTALQTFVYSIAGHYHNPSPKERVLRTVTVIERGMRES